MSNTTNNHNIETGLVVTCFVGFMATNAMAVFAPIWVASPLVLLISALASVGFFCSEVYPIHKVWRGVGNKAQHVKRIQAIMYLAAVVGGAMIALFRSGGSDFTCDIEGTQVICEVSRPGGNAVRLAVSGLLFLAGGFWALLLEPLRHRIEDRENALCARSAAGGRHRASSTG